ncbi:hypothetical protein ACFW04_002549 [Cataglyphis niger]
MCFLHKIHLRSHKLATGDRCVSLWPAPSNQHQYHEPALQRTQKHQKQTSDKPRRFADDSSYGTSFQSCPRTERRPDAKGREGEAKIENLLSNSHRIMREETRERLKEKHGNKIEHVVLSET